MKDMWEMKEKVGLSDQCHVINAVLLSNPDYVASKYSPAFSHWEEKSDKLLITFMSLIKNKRREKIFTVFIR